MRLFQFSYSPFAAKVRRCLELKGLAYEAVEVPYLDRRELVASTGGYAHVPVLVDAGEVVTDSARITAYLDRRYPPSLRSDPESVLVEQWADNLLEDAAFKVACPGLEDRMAAWNGREDARAIFRLMKERRYGLGCIERWRREAEGRCEELVAMLGPVVALVAERPFLLGGAPTLADASVYGQLFMIEAAAPGFIPARLPALRDWWERVRSAAPQR
ncbi:MAG TPA: glutathione S-transferase family protein [Anaeromyxobacteraceae bacterium]|nr:glutathione S-transferase family protein [Anaeromyxobacteraceae bacterium]